jgi:hypothetical protein
MEGSYSKVWRARKEVPREEYSYFVEELMGTIRYVLPLYRGERERVLTFDSFFF